MLLRYYLVEGRLEARAVNVLAGWVDAVVFHGSLTEAKGSVEGGAKPQEQMRISSHVAQHDGPLDTFLRRTALSSYRRRRAVVTTVPGRESLRTATSRSSCRTCIERKNTRITTFFQELVSPKSFVSPCMCGSPICNQSLLPVTKCGYSCSERMHDRRVKEGCTIVGRRKAMKATRIPS